VHPSTCPLFSIPLHNRTIQGRHRYQTNELTSQSWIEFPLILLILILYDKYVNRVNCNLLRLISEVMRFKFEVFIRFLSLWITKTFVTLFTTNLRIPCQYNSTVVLHTHVLTGGWTTVQRQSHHTDMNNNNNNNNVGISLSYKCMFLKQDFIMYITSGFLADVELWPLTLTVQRISQLSRLSAKAFCE
jgi:hypothetical protein